MTHPYLKRKTYRHEADELGKVLSEPRGGMRMAGEAIRKYLDSLDQPVDLPEAWQEEIARKATDISTDKPTPPPRGFSGGAR